MHLLSSPLLCHSYRMRYEHFPLFTHGIVRAQSECPASRQASSYIRGVSTASSSAIGSTYLRCTRYSYVDRVLTRKRSYERFVERELNSR